MNVMAKTCGTAAAAMLLWAPAWSLQVSGVTASLRGVSVVSDRVAWASGARGTVLRTTDGGATWTRRPVPDSAMLDFRDVDAVGEDVAYVLSIGDGEASRIYKTTDGGATWTLQFTNTNPNAFFDAMAFWDADRGIAVSDAVAGRLVVIRTDDGGRTWVPVPDADLPAALPGEGYFAASGTNVAVWGRDHVWLGTGAAARARVVRSSDGGRTWQVADTPLAAGAAAGIFSIAFRDATHGIVVGGDYSREREAVDNIAVTTDGGATWSLVRGPAGETSPLGGFRSVVRYIPGTQRLIAVGPSGADFSDDQGRTWTPIEGPGFHTFAFAPDGTVGWGAGSVGRIGRLSGF
jgi:photosystem II stability/assembly factor-like uncharacterized protein